jgi:hypothetical protein
MQPKYSLAEIKQAVHALSETDRATLRAYVIAVFDVRGRDARINLLAEERNRPRTR